MRHKFRAPHSEKHFSRSSGHLRAAHSEKAIFGSSGRFTHQRPSLYIPAEGRRQTADSEREK